MKRPYRGNLALALSILFLLVIPTIVESIEVSLVNPGFEDKPYDRGWQTWGETRWDANWTSGERHWGSTCLGAAHTYGWSVGAYQDFVVDYPKGTYTYDAYVKTKNLTTIGKAWTKLEWYDPAGNMLGPAIESNKLSGSVNWTLLSITSVAPCNAAKGRVVFKVAGGGNKQDAFFDDAAVRVVPASLSPKEVISLNGTWQLEPSNSNSQPANFEHTVCVPGLIDLSTPSINNWDSYDYFWYKKTFTLTSSQVHTNAFIKIGQSSYGTEVWLNGKCLGNYIGCYTSHTYDAADVINYNGENTLLIKVGDIGTLPSESAVGRDYEKRNYCPGIWGDVSLILTGNPYIKRIQIIPHIDANIAEARITVEDLEGIICNITISSRAFEKSTGEPSSDEITTDYAISPLEEKTFTINLPISNTELWSPDNPFLYNLVSKVKIGEIEVDALTTTFGMREFKIVGPDFYLNGQRIFLKGSNIAFHRFLSDPDRRELPWNESWIKRVLIDIPKEHNFNFFRNHLGQMYNKWYDVADEYGMMIQNEWAFWGITGEEEQIRREFTQWIYDNCNHPSIIIWDALNEAGEEREIRAIIREKIIPEMKLLDPTRPWECGLDPRDFNNWNPVDFSEEHPYIYSAGPVLNGSNFGFSRSIEGIKNSEEPTILDEFIWFWLDKNGNPTSLIDRVLPRWLGKSSTPQQRLEHQALIASDLCELWRRLGVDGIAPFIYLSIEGGFTSNWFTGDIANPGVKPIMSALKDAFAPFGVSIELWDRHFLRGEVREINVYLFNDYPTEKGGTLYCYIVDEEDTVVVDIGEYSVTVPASQTFIQPISWTMPSTSGTYYLKAELIPDREIYPVATSKKIAYVLEQPNIPFNLLTRWEVSVCQDRDISNFLHELQGRRSPKKRLPRLPRRWNLRPKIMVYDPDNEILDYLSSLDLNAVNYDNNRLFQQDILILGEGALLDSNYNSQIKEIANFVKQGHTLIVIEPSYGITNYERQEIPLLSDLSIAMNKRADEWEGGYDSYCFMEGLNLNIKGATASSVERNNPQFNPDKAIDKNLSTRWSSQQFGDPQWICLDLGAAVKFNRVILHWEYAYAKSYQIQVSNNKLTWTDVYSTTAGDGGIDEIIFEPVTARYVRMYATERATQWGYSLYEFRVGSLLFSLWNCILPEHLKMFNGGFGGEMISQCDVNLLTNKKQTLAASGLNLKYSDVVETIWGRGVVVISRIQVRGRLTEESDPGTDLYSRRIDPVAQQYLLNLISTYLDTTSNWQRINEALPFLYVKEATASSVEGDKPEFTPDKAIDSDISTRWSSQFADPQWICLDLGASVKLNRVILRWESAFAKSYLIQVSNDKVNWRNVRSIINGDGGVDDIKFNPKTARYVRMYGTKRATDYGYSLYEFEVYSPSTICHLQPRMYQPLIHYYFRTKKSKSDHTP